MFEHSDIAYGRMLGKGGEGIVYKCTVTYNGLPVDAAVKKVFNSSDDAISIILEEIELLWFVPLKLKSFWSLLSTHNYLAQHFI